VDNAQDLIPCADSNVFIRIMGWKGSNCKALSIEAPMLSHEPINIIIPKAYAAG
jgi:hypothetical protein